MKIAIYGSVFDSSFKPYVEELFNRLERENVEVCVYAPFYNFVINEMSCRSIECQVFNNTEEMPAVVDFLISIGGDGTFLASMQYLKSSTIPVIGINSGRLGFLANISKDEINTAFDAIFDNQFEFEYRSLLRAESEIELFNGYNFALNEVTVQKIDSALISVDAWIDDEFLNTYWTDGLIIATPTGSTAYSLSVGGPIIAPGASNFIITPIASHNLTVRPIVVPDDVNIKLKVKARSSKFLVTVDNRKQEIVANESTINIRKSKFELKMLKLPFNSFPSTLRNKLMWGMDKRNY